MVKQITLVIAFLISYSSISVAVTTGKDHFKLCSYCHGHSGEGKIEVKAPAIAGLPDWYVTEQLGKFKHGIRGKHPLDHSGLRMYPMGKMLDDEAIQQVSKYVAELKPHKPADILPGNAMKGKEIYVTCAACHGAKAEGNKALNSPPLTHLNDWYLFTQIKNFRHGIRAGDPTKDPKGAAMVPMAKSLADEQAIRDVLKYIKTL